MSSINVLETFVLFIATSSYGSNSISTVRVEGEFSGWLKSCRKGMSKDETKVKGLDIYDKTGSATVQEVIEFSYKEGYVRNEIVNKRLVLTEKGIEVAYKIITPSEEVYEDWIIRYMLGVSRVKDKNYGDDFWLRNHFYKGTDALELGMKDVGKLERKTMDEIYCLTEPSTNESHFHLLVIPKLFLDVQFINSHYNKNIECTVSCEQAGYIAIFTAYSQPFPNKRWLIPLEKAEVISIDKAHKKTTIKLCWSYGDILIDHVINLEIEDIGRGNYACLSDGSFMTWNADHYTTEKHDFKDVLQEVRPNLISYKCDKGYIYIEEDVYQLLRYPYGKDYYEVEKYFKKKEKEVIKK